MLDLIQRLEASDPQYALYLYDNFSSDPDIFPYHDFPARVAAHAAHFRSQGIGSGDRIIFPFETSAETIFGFLGLMEVGALPLSVKPLIMGTPKAAYREFLEEVARRYDAPRILAVPGVEKLDLDLTFVTAAGGDAMLPGARLRSPAADELAFVQFSSGSTSFPKGIPITHGNLVANLRMIADHDGRTLADRVTSWLPLYHDMGLIGGMLSCFIVGHDLHLAEPRAFLMNTIGWFEQMSQRRLTGSVIPNFAVDYALKILEDVDPADIAKLDLSTVRSIYLGSEPINIPNLESFLDLMEPAGLHRAVFLPCYGMAETVLMVTCIAPYSKPNIVTAPNGQLAISVGTPLEGFEVRVRDEQGILCAEGTLGEIEIRGGSLAGSYFEDERPLLNEQGAYVTGDVGFIQDGELFITGRLNDRFKINGQSFFAADFEQAAERVSFIRSGRVAAIQSDGKPLLLVEAWEAAVLDNADDSRKAIIDAVLERIGVALNPEQILLIRRGLIQRTSSGKLQRRAMTAAYDAGEMLPPLTRRAA